MVLKFIEFLNEGTFVGIRLDAESQQRIHAYQQANDIKEPIQGKDLHVTLIYSKKTMDDFSADGVLEVPYIATITGFANYNGVLVCELDCPDLEIKHTDLLHRYNGIHDYDSYSPHVSLSYNFQGDVDKLPVFDGNIKLVDEYMERAK